MILAFKTINISPLVQDRQRYLRLDQTILMLRQPVCVFLKSFNKNCLHLTDCLCGIGLNV